MARGRASAGRAPLVATLGAVLATLGVASSFGHLTGVDASSFWVRLTSLRLQTGIAFAIGGAGLVATAWQESVTLRPVVPRWFPLVVAAAGTPSVALLGMAFAAQYFGLLAERWYFFAQARHPQNLYYQAVS